jgi:hypothetical protein
VKIEIGESLLLSWLRHIKECQLVQTNWKASAKWELKNKEVLELLMQKSSEVFGSKYGYDLYKNNSGIDQLLRQAEIDVMGIYFEENQKHIYAIDVAFHEAGLNYGSKDETVTRVFKKCIRTAMCIYGYFGLFEGTIIFASPKINPSVIIDIERCIDDITSILQEFNLNYEIRIIANEAFSEKVLEPILSVLGDVSDTSELFMRSLQMYNLFASKKTKTDIDKVTKPSKRAVSSQLKAIEYNGINGLEEMKIGVIARTVLRNILESDKLSEEELALLQTKEYSKDKFDIQYPLLLKVINHEKRSPVRYYSTPLKIHGELCYLCSEWFEVPNNNDRPYLLNWLALHDS